MASCAGAVWGEYMCNELTQLRTWWLDQPFKAHPGSAVQNAVDTTHQTGRRSGYKLENARRCALLLSSDHGRCRGTRPSVWVALVRGVPLSQAQAGTGAHSLPTEVNARSAYCAPKRRPRLLHRTSKWWLEGWCTAGFGGELKVSSATFVGVAGCKFWVGRGLDF